MWKGVAGKEHRARHYVREAGVGQGMLAKVAGQQQQLGRENIGFGWG